MTNEIQSRSVNRYVSERLRDLRLSRGLSQRQAADLLTQHTHGSWTVQAISRAELCEGVYIKRWNVDDLYALAAAFDVPIAYFLPHDVAGHRSTRRPRPL